MDGWPRLRGTATCLQGVEHHYIDICFCTIGHISPNRAAVSTGQWRIWRMGLLFWPSTALIFALFLSSTGTSPLPPPPLIGQELADPQSTIGKKSSLDNDCDSLAAITSALLQRPWQWY